MTGDGEEDSSAPSCCVYYVIIYDYNPTLYNSRRRRRTGGCEEGSRGINYISLPAAAVAAPMYNNSSVPALSLTCLASSKIALV